MLRPFPWRAATVLPDPGAMRGPELSPGVPRPLAILKGLLGFVGEVRLGLGHGALPDAEDPRSRAFFTEEEGASGGGQAAQLPLALGVC